MSNQFVIFDDWDFPGSDFNQKDTNMDTMEECARYCLTLPGCVSFTFDVQDSSSQCL